MKKILSVLLTSAILLSFTACGGNSAQAENGTAQNSSADDNGTNYFEGLCGKYDGYGNELLIDEDGRITFNGTDCQITKVDREMFSDSSYLVYFSYNGAEYSILINPNANTVSVNTDGSGNGWKSYAKYNGTEGGGTTVTEPPTDDEQIAWNKVLELDGSYNEADTSKMTIENGVISVYVEEYHTKKVYGDFVISRETGGTAYFDSEQMQLHVGDGKNFSMIFILDSVEHGYLQSEMYVDSEYLGGFIFIKEGGIADTNGEKPTDTDGEQRYYYCQCDPSTIPEGSQRLFAYLTYDDGVYQLELGYGSSLDSSLYQNWYVTFTASGQTEVSYKSDPDTGNIEERDTVTMTLTDSGMHLKLVSKSGNPPIVNEYDMQKYPLND